MAVSLDHPHGNEWMLKKGPSAGTHWTPCPTCGITCRWWYGPLPTSGPAELTIDCLNAECSTNYEGES